jgi:hypothetical protein
MKGFRLQDGSTVTTVSATLPTATGGINLTSAVTTGLIDLQCGPNDDFLAQTEFQIDAPACATGALTAGGLLNIDVCLAPNSDASCLTVANSIYLQTVSLSGVGAPATSKRYRLPSNPNNIMTATNTTAFIFLRASITTSTSCASLTLNFYTVS